MEEAREAIFELGKEVTRGFIQSAPRAIDLITLCKRVGQNKFLEQLISDEDRWKAVINININRTVVKIWDSSFFLTILSKDADIVFKPYHPSWSSPPLTSGSIVDVDVKIKRHFEEKLDPTRHDEHESLLTKEEASNLMVRKRDFDR